MDAIEYEDEIIEVIEERATDLKIEAKKEEGDTPVPCCVDPFSLVIEEQATEGPASLPERDAAPLQQIEVIDRISEYDQAVDDEMMMDVLQRSRAFNRLQSLKEQQAKLLARRKQHDVDAMDIDEKETNENMDEGGDGEDEEEDDGESDGDIEDLLDWRAKSFR